MALPVLDPKAAHCPCIIYRPIRLSDLEVLQQVHAALFPIRYDMQFFHDVVYGNGIVSWAAVDINRPDSQKDEIIGFVTTRITSAKDSEIENLLSYNGSREDKKLVYILTLGVIEHYRNLGIATSLVQEVLKYASSIETCRGVYLHVIDYNQPAIHFYKKMLFKLVRNLPKFYYINGQHYDSYLFVYFINGAESTGSKLDIVTDVVAYVRSLFTLLVAKLWRKEEQVLPGSDCKETSSLAAQNNRILKA